MRSVVFFKTLPARVRALVLGLCVSGGLVTQAAAQTNVTLDWQAVAAAEGLPSGSPFPQTPNQVQFSSAGVTATFDWDIVVDDDEPPAGDTDGVTLPFLSDFVTYNDFAFGNQGVGNLVFVMDNNAFDTGDRVVFSMDLNQEVTNLAFNLLQLSTSSAVAGAPVADEAVEVFYDDGSGVFQNLADLPGATALSGPSIVPFQLGSVVNGWEGNADIAFGDTSGNLLVNFGATPVKRLRVEIFTADDAPADPGGMLVGFSDMSWTVAAPPVGQSDLGVSIVGPPSTPFTNAPTFFDVTVTNFGAETATNVTVDVPLPSGQLSHLSNNAAASGGNYNPATGLWTLPATLPNGASVTMRVSALAGASTAPISLAAEVASSDQSDPDSTPGNGAPSEDDIDTITLTPQINDNTIFCLSRPVSELSFVGPQAESPGASLTAPAVGNVFRYSDVAPGVDALVEVLAFHGGATIDVLDDDTTDPSLASNFQPSLDAPTGEASIDFAITLVATGTTNGFVSDFAGATIDVDGGGSLLEFAEVSNNIVELALDANTDLIVRDPAPDLPSAPGIPRNRVRFGASTATPAPGGGISLAPENIATAFFTDVSVFNYTIGKTGGAFTGRLYSLAFDCPSLTTPAPDPGASEDFGDVPFDTGAGVTGYGNPIHAIISGIQIGATNTAELVAGNSATASSDTGDDGVTLPASFSAGNAETISANVQGTGYLQVFFDWNIDGDFDDPGEHAGVDVQDSDGDGLITVNVIPPPSDTVGGSSFARFRWATTAGLGVQDAASDGEVEDYPVTLIALPPADLSLDLVTGPANPLFGGQVTLTFTVTNDGPETVGGIVVNVDIGDGLSFASDNGLGAYNSNTGVWTLPTDLAVGESASLLIVTNVETTGSYDITAEIAATNRPDADSAVGNASTSPGEDDDVSVTLTPTSAPSAALVCPAGLVTSTSPGNATAAPTATGVTNPGQALGPLSLQGASTLTTIAAELNATSDLLTLDLGALVPENAELTISLARDTGTSGDASFLEVRSSADNVSFAPLVSWGVGTPLPDIVSNAQGVIEHITVTAPPGGVQFLQFQTARNADVSFVDGVAFNEICVVGAELNAVKTTSIFDPDALGLFSIPGNDVTYTISVTNQGEGPTDADTVVLIDELPPEVEFFNGDVDGPTLPETGVIGFDAGTSGLTFNEATDLAFSNSTTRPASFGACTYTPIAGYDPAVTFVCLNPSGAMLSGNPDPVASFTFRARIR